jgi:hypothetical protein
MGELSEHARAWVEHLRSLKLPDDAELAELLLEKHGDRAGVADIQEVYALARENKLPTEIVSKVLSYLRRRAREEGKLGWG